MFLATEKKTIEGWEVKTSVFIASFELKVVREVLDCSKPIKFI